MKTQSLLWGAVLVLLLGLAPGPAHATLITQYRECSIGITPILCGVGPSRQAAGESLTAQWCNTLTDGRYCYTQWWEAKGQFLGAVGANVCIGEPVYPNCRQGEYALTNAGATTTIDTCTIATGTSGPCGETVARLKAIAKAPDDPTRVFHQTLICITGGSCALRCDMDNCDWLKEVVPLFNNKYLAQVEEWPEVMANCRARGTGIASDIVCAIAEGRHHIFADLVPALVAAGCGSQADWNKVFSVIKTCAQQTGDSMFPGAGDAAASGTWAARSAARAMCQAQRTARGLDPAINPSISGQICTP